LNSNSRSTDLFRAAVFLNKEGKPPLYGLTAALRFTPWGRFTNLRRQIDAIIFEEIAERRKSAGKGGDDVLSLLLAARDRKAAV